MELDPRIGRAIKKMSFEKLLPVQEQSIPLIMQGKNLLAQSKTGTGKTAAFAIPILQKLDEKQKLQALVLEPTRELAIQVGNEFRKIGAEMPFRVVVAYGGTPDDRQKELLEKGANIMVGTPDRVLDLVSSGHAKLDKIAFLVLDEADLLLDYALALKTRKLLKSVPEKAQKLFFCVHLPGNLEEDVKKYLGDFEKVKTFSFGKLSENLKHDVLKVEEDKKFSELKKLLNERKKTLVFCKTKESTSELNERLGKSGFKTRMIHGDFDQTRRNSAISSFKAGHANILVATDVAARGLHIPELDLVINYELPQNYDYYLHRIGRTARLSASGRVVTFVSKADAQRWKEIKNKTGIA
ncbi:TPA: DEAD/DEAH box helicase [Candidatus Micrarchaeota archaeon]|nr:DEAD/DEAH box helicase [Candidatus Micrarchaeota archaeon]